MDFFKSFHSEVGWFFWGLVLVGVIWFWRGGASSPTAQEPYIKPLAPLNTGEVYGDSYAAHNTTTEKLDLPENPITLIRNFFGGGTNPAATDIGSAPFSKYLLIDGTAGTAATDPQAEYVRVIANRENSAPVVLSGLTLTGSAYSVRGTIPQAIDTLVLASSTKATDVFMPPQGRAIITSGKSPVGASFRVNECTGYLGQFQTFTPDLLVNCPNPTDELRDYGPYDDASCRAFVSKLPACRSFNGSFPSDLGASCKKFVSEKLSYNACVADHSTDPSFHKNEWRLFLGSDKELWKDKQEVIRLYDAKGTTIDAITY